MGDWVLIRYPHEETGKLRKLSRPWHRPYRITSCDNTGMSAVKVYFPREDAVKVHQTRVKPCPDGLLAGYYWYGTKRKGPGRPPKWVEKILSDTDKEVEDKPQEEPDSPMASVTETETPVGSTEPGQNKHESVQVSNSVLKRYSLRKNPKPPERLYECRSRRALQREGVM